MNIRLTGLRAAIQRLSTMRQKTFFMPGSERRSARALSVVLPGRRYLLIAVLLSICVHLFAALLIVSLPRLVPTEARKQEQGTVELLMVEQKGSQKTQAESKPVEATPKKVEAPEAEPEPSVAKPEPAPPVSNHADLPPPSQSEQAPPKPDAVASRQEQAKQPPTPPGPREAPVFNLEGTDSESNAIALGSNILPAMPDNRYRNRPPAYPVEAEMRGQHGAVVIMIHVAENGLAAGVEVVESSGVEALDQAAVAAVRKWRFHPALKAGSPVPFDMPFRFVFEPY